MVISAAHPAAAYSIFNPVRTVDLRSLCVDRPGKATPPCIVDAGHVQLEVGVVDAAFASADGHNANQYAIAGSNVRVGLGPTTEALVNWTPLQIAHLDERRFSGVGDVSFGIKQSLANPDGSGFSVAVQALATAPTAGYHPGNHDWTAALSLPVALALGSFNLGFTPEVDVLPNALQGGNHLAYSAVVALGHALGPISAGIELWTARDVDPAGSVSATTLDLTAAWVPGHAPDWQFDCGINFGLNQNIASTEAYFGVSHRF